MLVKLVSCLSLQDRDTRSGRAETADNVSNLDEKFAQALSDTGASASCSYDFINCCKAVTNCRNPAVLYHVE